MMMSSRKRLSRGRIEIGADGMLHLVAITALGRYEPNIVTYALTRPC